MIAGRLVFTVFVVFVSVIATLLLVNVVGPDADSGSATVGEPVYTMAQVARHGSEESCWKVIDGVVYDVTEYIPYHPSAKAEFVLWCGREATAAWYRKSTGRAHSARAEAILADYRIGVIADSADQSTGGTGAGR